MKTNDCLNCGKPVGTQEALCPYCGKLLPVTAKPSSEKDKLGRDLRPGYLLHDRYNIVSMTSEDHIYNYYEADDTRLKRKCVIIQYKGHIDIPAKVDRLNSVLKGLARLNHPNIAVHLDQFFDDDNIYLVEEKVTGHSLRQIKEGQGYSPDPVTVTVWAEQVISAVDYLHRQGLVHGALDPDYIVFSNEGHIKLINQCRLWDIRSILLQENMISRQDVYIAPEALVGEPTAQSDIYSIGMILSYMLQIDTAALSGRPKKGHGDKTEIASLISTLRTAIAQDAGKRFASVNELKVALSAPVNIAIAAPGQVVRQLSKPKLVIRKRKFDLGFINSGPIVQKNIRIANAGEEPLIGTIISHDPAVTVSPSTINVIKEAEHAISVDTSHIRPSSRYATNIYISTNGGDGYMEVKWAGRAVLSKLIKTVAIVAGACSFLIASGIGITVWQSNEGKRAAAMDPVARIEPLSGVAGTEFKVTGNGPKSAQVYYDVVDASGKSMESLSSTQNANGEFFFSINTVNYLKMGEYKCKVLSSNGKSCDLVFRLEPKLSDIKMAYLDELKPPGAGWFGGLMTEGTENTFTSEQDGYTAYIASRMMLYHVPSPKQCMGRDFAVSVDVERVSATGDEISGVSFREQDEKNYYAFLVDSFNQQYTVVQVADGNWYQTPWQGSQIIDKKSNKLRVAAQDRKIYFYINEKILDSTDDDGKESPGYIGLAAGTLFKPEAKFKFSNFKLSSANTRATDRNNAVSFVLPRQSLTKPDNYKADLKILDFWTESPNPYIYYKIKNTGCAMSDPSKTYLYVLTSQRDSSAVSPMLPGETRVLRFAGYAWSFPSPSSGKAEELAVKVIADAEKNNSEENENNNNLVKTANSKGDIAPTNQSDNGKTPPNMGQIAFLRCDSQSKNNDWGNRGRIFLVNTDGTGFNQISLASITSIKADRTKRDYQVEFLSSIVWSPDGSKIAFAADTGTTKMDIYYADSSGANGKRLVDWPGMDTYPTWSSNGSKIAFSSNHGGSGGTSYIYIAGIDGESDPVQGPAIISSSLEVYPSYAKDESRILYVAKSTGGYGIYERDIANKNDKKISNETWPALSRPAISPDGKKFAYVMGKDDQKELWLRDIDGSNPKQLTKDDGYLDDYPCWSPDGTKIAYVHLSYKLDGSDNFEVSQSGIYIMNDDGSDPLKIPGTTHLDWSPTWK